MRIKYPAETDRKKLVVAAAEYLGEKPVYAGAPTMNYILGAYTVACDRTLTGPDDRDLVAALREQGYEPVEETYDSESTVPGNAEAEQPDRMSIDMILVDYPAEAIGRLRRLVDSKAPLLKMALGTDELPILVEGMQIKFPWFPCDGNAAAYTQLTMALCRTAKEKRRVNARPQKECPNPRFTMRCWLTTTLGLVGDEHRQIRKLLCAPLEGNSAWSQGHAPRKAVKAETADATEPTGPDEEGGEDNE